MVNFYNQQNRQNGDSAIPASPLASATAKKKKVDIGKYTDPTGEFGTTEFKRAVWFAKNKLLLYRLVIIFLAAFSAITICFSLWKAFTILYFDLTAGRQMDAELSTSPNYAALHPRFAPAPIEILNSTVLPETGGKIGVWSELANPNARYIVYFDYYYDFGGVASAKQAGFLLPQETKPMVQLGIDTNVYPGSPNLMVENIRWERISAHTVPDTAAWQAERSSFSVENFVFSFSGEQGLNASAIRFSLINNSAYGFRNPVFYVGLYNNGGLVGAMRFDLADFESLQRREIDLRNYTENLTVSEIKVFPIIDLYDNSVYLPPRR
jgi:hypothetical protein